MNNFLISLATRFWPKLNTLSHQRRLVGAGDVITTLYSIPLALFGIGWLVSSTNLALLYQEWLLFIFFFSLIAVFNRFSYFFIIEIRRDRYGSADGSLSTMIQWAAIFLLGLSSLWLSIIWIGINFVWNWTKSISTASRWNLLRSVSISFAQTTIAPMTAITIYKTLGGVLPLPNLSIENVLLSFTALSVDLVMGILIWTGYIIYHIRVQTIIAGNSSVRPIIRFFLLSFGLPFLSHPFGILAAGLYDQNGLSIFIFFIVGLVLVAILGRQLSWVAENSRQQSRQLEKLEQLGRALLEAPPDGSTVPDILEQHVQNMFPSGRIAIWLSNNKLLVKHPSDWPDLPEEVWLWILVQSDTQAFQSKDVLPWKGKLSDHNPLIVSPVIDMEDSKAIGGIYLELRTLVQTWDIKSLSNLFPAVQSLGAQIASAMHQVVVYERMLEYQNITQELRLAGKIQASFLPNKFPTIPGWQLAVTMLPARETSGDFFDVINLSDGRLGILIADVADKGVGPALFMALTRTLIRTYAIEYDAEPEVVFFAANDRLLNDTRASLFVTAFYGILDPESGTFSYCNAGHNPPYIFRHKENGGIKILEKTGIPLGIESGSTWGQEEISIYPGDVLILYTDGIPDAQNSQGNFFEEENLIETAQSHLGMAAHEIQSVILEKVQNFVGDVPQFDDITLMVLVRDS